MQIPKVIHYIWLSGEEFPESIKLIQETWKRILPDYKLKLWTSDDYNQIENKPNYIIKAYNEKKWAFVSDYIRIYALYKEGGWYFDTDLQIIRNDLDDLGSKYSVVSALEPSDKKIVQIQAAFLGGIKGHPFFKSIMDYYNNIDFEYKDLSTLLAPTIYAKVAESYGFKYIKNEQLLQDNIFLVSFDKVLAHRIHLKNIHIPFAIHHCFHGWASAQWSIQKNDIILFDNINQERWVIQSFWTKPLLKNNQDIEYHIKLAKLSLYYIHRSGYKVKMYTDSYGYKKLNHLPYDDISTILNDIPNNISTNLFAAGKFWALRDAGVGVVHIDYDVFIKKATSISDFYIDNTIDVILQNKEGLYPEIYKGIANTIKKLGVTKYYDPFHKSISNVGVIGFNNKDLLEIYLHNYFENLKYIDMIQLDKEIYNKLDFSLEQIAIDYLSQNYKVKYVFNKLDELRWIGYQHLQGISKYNTYNKKMVNKILEKIQLY